MTAIGAIVIAALLASVGSPEAVLQEAGGGGTDRTEAVASGFCSGGGRGDTGKRGGPKFDARLVLSGQASQPGGVFRARVRNLGSGAIVTSPGYQLERFEQGTWLPVSAGSPQLKKIGVPPGGATKCAAIRVPLDAVPGSWRVVKRVSQSKFKSAVSSKGRQRTLFAYFTVNPS